MSPGELRNFLYQNARGDDFTGQLPNNIWGWGKVDVAPALAAGNPSRLGLPGDFGIVSLYPNPFNDRLMAKWSGISTGSLGVTLMDLNGRILWADSAPSHTGQSSGIVPIWVQGLPSGRYIIAVSGGGSVCRVLASHLK
jgi:hypothetical protein